MGDAGYRDERGQLWFCGRKNHRVVTTQGRCSPIWSSRFEYASYVARTALVGVTRKRPGVSRSLLGASRPVRTKGIPAAQTEWIEKTLLEKAGRFEQTKAIKTGPRTSGFPVDVRIIPKSSANKLAVWGRPKLGPSWNGGPA